MNDLRQSTANTHAATEDGQSENEYIIKILMTTIALIDISGGNPHISNLARKQWRSSHFA